MGKYYMLHYSNEKENTLEVVCVSHTSATYVLFQIDVTGHRGRQVVRGILMSSPSINDILHHPILTPETLSCLTD